MRLYVAFLRWAFRLFYNPFAFTYDWVSALVSRGHWRAWTRAAIPQIVGSRVLEIPCGTGNLWLDLCAAGYVTIGVDLSSAMLNIAQKKFRRAARSEGNAAESKSASLLRARAQRLPFPSCAFDSITMTFPPGFAGDPQVFTELRRVLVEGGRLIWVDAARLLPRDWLSRALNAALDAVGGGGAPFQDFATQILTHAGFQVQVDIVKDEASVVTVVTGTRGSSL
jgi:ubiquinone/menaquinone biosynthesis C-methylase UbiE